MLAEKVKYPNEALLIMRLTLGFMLISHGLLGANAKLFGIPGPDAFFGGLLVPLPFIIAAIVEGIGGLLLIFGGLTRLTSLLVAIQFLIIYIVDLGWLLFMGLGNADRTFSNEIALLTVGASIMLLVLGAGKYSVDKMVIKRELI